MPDLISLSTPAALEAQDRRRQMLRTAFGPTIAAALADPTVLEVMVNPDGRLWIDRAAAGRTDSELRAQARRRPGAACGLIGRISPMRRLYVRIVTAASMLVASCHLAMAAGSGMPWEAPLQRILESIEGPVAKVVAVVTIILTGLSLSFGDMGGAFRRMVQVVFGLSIAFAATSFFLSFFSFAGGALID